MPRGSGLRGSGLSLRSIRSDLKGSPTYENFLSSRKQEIKAQSTLKYGGGFGRKVLYGMTKSVTGEQVADQIAQMFRDKGKTEEAYQTLKGEDRKETSITPKIEKLSSSIEDTKTSIESVNETATEILKIVGDISKKLSPKDITVGKGEAQQTFRYDPLAPEGKKVTVVTGSGKAGRFASKKEAASVLSKAAYLGNLTQTPTPSTVERLPRSPRLVREAMQQAMVPMQPRSMQRQIREPETYEELLGARKNLSKAEKTLRYGGSGLGRRALFGITKGLVGERAALKIATLGRNKAQTEQAYQTVLNRGMDAQPNLSRTQVSAKAGMEGRTKSELEEENTEWKEDVIKRLERIERKIDNLDGGMLGGLLGGIGGGLGRIFGRNKPKPGGSRPKPGGGRPTGGGKPPGAPKSRLPKIPGAVKGIGAGAIIGFGADMAADYLGRDTTAGAGADVLGETATYASTGALIGSVIPGVGTAIGGAIGGAVGLGKGLYENREVLFGSDEEEELPPLRGREIPVDASNPNLNKETEAEVQALEEQFKPLTEDEQMMRLGIQPSKTGKVEAEKIETKELKVEDMNLQRLTQTTGDYEKSVEENAVQTQTPQQPVIINNSSPPPPMPPPSKSGEGSGTIQIRNTEPSVATYNASIFDHPVTHPGIYKM